MEGNRHAVTPRLAHERAVDRLELGRPARLDVLEHRREVPVATLGREDVHLPRVVVHLDAGRERDGAALVDEVADEVAEIGEPLGLRRSGSRAEGR